MDRLTINQYGCNQIIDCKDDICRETCNKMDDCAECPINKAINRLAAYEDTGMDPQEISAMMAEYTALIEQAGDREAMDPDLEEVFANYIGLYDSIHILQNGGILDEEEVQICEHNLLFQIIGMMQANISRERSESR